MSSFQFGLLFGGVLAVFTGLGVAALLMLWRIEQHRREDREQQRIEHQQTIHAIDALGVLARHLAKAPDPPPEPPRPRRPLRVIKAAALPIVLSSGLYRLRNRPGMSGTVAAVTVAALTIPLLTQFGPRGGDDGEQAPIAAPAPRTNTVTVLQQRPAVTPQSPKPITASINPAQRARRIIPTATEPVVAGHHNHHAVPRRGPGPEQPEPTAIPATTEPLPRVRTRTPPLSGGGGVPGGAGGGGIPAKLPPAPPRPQPPTTPPRVVPLCAVNLDAGLLVATARVKALCGQ